MSDLDTGYQISRKMWVCAAIGVLLLHVGGAAFALTQFRGDDEGGGLGSAAEYAVEMASPKVDDDDKPPGDDTDAQQASPPLPDQVAEKVETDLPKDTPAEAEDPDRVVTTNDSKKPVEQQDKVATVQTQASPEAAPQVETSKKSLENAPEADRAKSPSVGTGKDKEQLTENWERKIIGYFKLHQRYPAGKTSGANVKVLVVLNRRGNVLSVEVVESSGDTVYDEAAVSMVHRSDPFPAPPAKLTDEQFSYILPVNFPPVKCGRVGCSQVSAAR